jgi:hypothetical protein
MKRTQILTAFAVLPLSAIAATPFQTSTIPAHLRIAHGQSIQQAIQQARFDGRIGALHAAHGNMVVGSKAIQPEITGGSIVSMTLTVGQANSIPAAQLSYKTGPAGLSGIELVFSSPNGNESLALSYFPQDISRHATVMVEQPGNVPYYSQPGQWQLVAAYVADYAGNYNSYTQAQLANLFPTSYITVVNNGPVDITPPVVTSGQILTPTVSLSAPVPVFEATLTGADDVSGLYVPYVAVQEPGGSFGQVNYAPMPIPLLSGTGTAYSTLFAGQTVGTWTITAYAFCDVAGNCFDDQSETDIQNLFGTTTFQVTN